MSKEREAFEEVFPCSTGTVLNEYGHYESQVNQQDAMIQNISWVVWRAAKAQAVPEGFVIVSQKDLLELTIAINSVDLATHTESKTNEVREMWQQVALKLMALGTSDCPDEP